MKIEIPVPYGELIDKLTILDIKKVKISDQKKLENVENEFNILAELYSGKNPPPHLILGIKKDATIAEIKSAWISLAQKHHPDHLFAKGMPEEFISAATERLATINIAYKIMLKQKQKWVKTFLGRLKLPAKQNKWLG